MQLAVLQEPDSDTCLIPLSQGRHAIVDRDIYPFLSQHKWSYSASGGGYAVRVVLRKTILMHRFILQAPKGVQVDHINGDPLDNRRCNLRLATAQQNRRNMAPRSGKSKYKGVCTFESRWRASITVDYKTIHLGLFPTEIQAARAYNEAAIRYFGEFARLNDI